MSLQENQALAAMKADRRTALTLAGQLQGEIAHYWDIAYAEGEDERHHDDGKGARCLARIETLLSHLVTLARKGEEAKP